MPSPANKKFTSTYEKFPEGLYVLHFKVSQEIYDHFTKDGKKRVICSVNANENFHAGFLADGKGGWYIKLNKDKEKKYCLTLGDSLKVNMQKDETKYGMHMPEEFGELLVQDPEGEKHFENLTDGKKRSLIYKVDSVKSSDKKLERAITILDYLKASDGKLDWKELNIAFQQAKSI